MCSNQKIIVFNFIFSVALCFLLLTESKLVAQWQFAKDFKVNDDTELDIEQNRPAIACNSSGKFVMTWNDLRNKGDYYYDIYAQIFGANGELVGNNFYVIYKLFLQAEPDIAIKQDGSFIITWLDDTGGCAPEMEFNLYAKFYDTDGIPSAQIQVNDLKCSVWQSQPQVKFAASGNFVVVWTDQRDGFYDGTRPLGRIFCQMYDADSNPIGNNFKVNEPVDKTKECKHPSAAMDENSNFIIIWHDNRNGNFDIYGQCYLSNGTPVGSNFLINDDNSATNQNFPVVDMRADGSFVVCWVDKRNSEEDIFAQRFDSNGNPIGANFKVSDIFENSAQKYPTIALKSDGKFVIAWQDNRNGDYDIYTQKYDADGAKIGVNIRLNDDNGSASQEKPDVACSGEKIYYTWQDNRIPNENYDVFARVVYFASNDQWLAVNSPELADKWIIGETSQITWSTSEALGSTLVIELSTDNGTNWKTLTSSVPFDAAYFEYTPNELEVSDQCQVKISSNNYPSISDISDRFNIFKPAKSYHAKQFFCSTDPILLDGNLNEPIWSDVKAESLLFGGVPEQWTANWTDFTDLLVTWKAIWSPENNRIYLGIEVTDDTRGTLDNNDPNESLFYPFNDESVELYVDGDHSGGLYQGSYESAQQWLITTENLRILNYYVADKLGVYSGNALQSAVTLGSDGNWVIEAELTIYNTFETAERTLAPGDTIGWDIWHNDSDDETVENSKYARDHQTGWYYTEQAYKNADCFGNLILSDMVVPVELRSFEAQVNRNCVQLIWHTSSESNNYGFEIQRSFNGINFEKISFIQGKGTVTSHQNYIFEDKNISAAVYYYRLKQVDYNGKYCFSSVIRVEVNRPSVYHLYPGYPNPFNPETNICYDLPETQQVVLKIYNLNGQEIAILVDKMQQSGSYSVEWNAKDQPSGIYICKMKAGSFSSSLKLIVVK